MKQLIIRFSGGSEFQIDLPEDFDNWRHDKKDQFIEMETINAMESILQPEIFLRKIK